MDPNAASSLARGLMNEHGLGHWVFQWDRSVSRLGACHYRQTMITLSYDLTVRAPEATIRDTILHEIAHAIAGHAAGHGLEWYKVAVMIGCNGKRCYSDNDVERIAGKWQAVCPGCGKRFHKHRLVRKDAIRWCTKCGSVKGRLTYREAAFTPQPR